MQAEDQYRAAATDVDAERAEVKAADAVCATYVERRRAVKEAADGLHEAVVAWQDAIAARRAAVRNREAQLSFNRAGAQASRLLIKPCPLCAKCACACKCSNVSCVDDSVCNLYYCLAGSQNCLAHG